MFEHPSFSDLMKETVNEENKNRETALYCLMGAPDKFPPTELVRHMVKLMKPEAIYTGPSLLTEKQKKDAEKSKLPLRQVFANPLEYFLQSRKDNTKLLL